MKRLLSILFFAALTLASWAQVTNALDQVKADPKKAYGTDYPYSFTVPTLTKTPKGYKPFYISHYGRHGSRYYWNEMLYPQLDTLLVTAHRRHQLQRGRDQRARHRDGLGYGALRQQVQGGGGARG